MNDIVTSSLSALDFIAVLPEIYLLVMVVVVLLLECFAENSKFGIKQLFVLVLSSLCGAIVLAIYAGMLLPSGSAPTYYWGGEVIHSSVITTLKCSMLLTVILGLIYGYPRLTDERLARSEYYLLILLSSIGMLVLVSGFSLLMIYLGLELMSLPMYALVAFNRQSMKGTEAAMKYFVMGAMASGILLFGMALLYGATGGLNLEVIQTAMTQIAENNIAHNQLLIFALVFVTAGVAFKLGAAPFHAWVPDVYEGAPVSVALFINAAPKIAAVAMAFSLLGIAGFNISEQWQMMLAMVIVVSFVIGNFIALKQTNIRRMLGYSAISHAGFILLGIFSGDNGDVANSAFFYVITYAFTTAAAFGFLLLLKNNDKALETILELKGLAKTDTWLAFLMACIMLSMGGIPPFVGFYAKFFVLKNAYFAGYWPVVVIGLITSVVGLFYYLRIIKVMFFDDQESYHNITVETSVMARVVLNVNVAAILALGLMPAVLVSLL